MKRRTIIGLGLVLMLTACSNVEQDADTLNVIRFHVMDSDVTRAVSSSDQFGSFRVVTLQHETNETPTLFMGFSPSANTYQGELVTYDSEHSRWNTVGTHFWPQLYYYLDFYATYPVSLPNLQRMSSNGGDGYFVGIPSYTVNSGTPDIRYAFVSQNKTVAEANGGAVTLAFHHALAQVTVLVTIDNTATVNSITIDGVCQTGTLNMTAGAWQDLSSSATLSLSRGATAYVIPQDLQGHTVTVNYTYGGNTKEATGSLSSGMNMTQGHIYTLELSVRDTEVTLSTVSIANWTNPYANTTPPKEFTQEIEH